MVNNQEVKYEGFATPSLILDGSDTSNSGRIVDPYAKTEEQDGLLCGNWSRGMDGKIHIYLVKPVAAICDEREEWVVKQTLLKEPISYMPPVGVEIETPTLTKPKAIPQPKKKVVFDKETKQFRMI